MNKKIRMNYGEVKANLINAIENMPAEQCKELLREMTVSILTKHRSDDREVKEILEKSYEARILTFLTTLGMPTHLKGHSYTKAAIVYLNEYKQKHGFVCSMTKELYPHVAKTFATTANKIERSIRNAIELTWDRANPDILNKIFGYTVSIGKSRPTNSEFLSMVVEYLKVNDN